MKRSLIGLITMVGLLSPTIGPANAQVSRDGSELVPNPSLTSRDGVWTFGPSFAGWQGYWYVFLNGRSANGGAGHKLVMADGGKVFLESMSSWFVWNNGEWVKASAPPDEPGIVAPPSGVVLRVGPLEQYKTVKSAVDVANGDKSEKDYVVEIAPGTYNNEFMDVYRAMTIRSMGGPVILRATTSPTNGKGIIVAWAPLVVDGLTFQGSTEPSSGNGAGIRDHNNPGGSLRVSNSLFMGNDVGILTDSRAVDEQVVIINSKFVNNGLRSQHALYVNAGRLTVSGSLFCGQLVGHLIKSRASDNDISGNEIYDGAANAGLGCRQGTSSLAIDISNGGNALINGNTIVQGPGSPQYKMVSYGGEGLVYQTNRLIVANNTFASPGTSYSTAIYDPRCIRKSNGSMIVNNTFESIRTQIDPPTC